MPHVYSIAVTSKVDGDFQTEDDIMNEIQVFAKGLREKHKDKASVLVRTDYGVDPNEFVQALKQPKKEEAADQIQVYD